MLTNISKLALSIILLMCVGCSPSARETANTPSQNAVNPAAPTAKLRIQKEKDGTGVYQSEFFLRSQFFVAGKPVIGQHKGELWNTASYKGDKAKCVLENLAIMIKHSKPERSGWQFPKSAKILLGVIYFTPVSPLFDLFGHIFFAFVFSFSSLSVDISKLRP